MNEITSLLNNIDLYKETLEQNIHVQLVNQIASTYSSEQLNEDLFLFSSIINHYNGMVNYYDLLENNHMLNKMLKIAQMHYDNGTRIDYFLSAITVRQITYEIMLYNSNIPPKKAMQFIINCHKILSAFNLLFATRWVEHVVIDRKKEQVSNKLILDHLEYPVIITDHQGAISFVNRAGQVYFLSFDAISKKQKHIFDLLDYHFISFKDFLALYKDSSNKIIRFLNGEQFKSSILMLNNSLYMVTLEPLEVRDSLSTYNIPNLTPTESEVCEYVKLDLPTKDIAEKMNIAEATIKTHRRSIRKKLGLTGSNASIQEYLNRLRI